MDRTTRIKGHILNITDFSREVNKLPKYAGGCTLQHRGFLQPFICYFQPLQHAYKWSIRINIKNTRGLREDLGPGILRQNTLLSYHHQQYQTLSAFEGKTETAWLSNSKGSHNSFPISSYAHNQILWRKGWLCWQIYFHVKLHLHVK